MTQTNEMPDGEELNAEPNEELTDELNNVAGGRPMTRNLKAKGLAGLHRPISGIESVSNPQPTTRGEEPESDAQLRPRTRRPIKQ